MSLKNAKAVLDKHIRVLFTMIIIVALGISIFESLMPFEIPTQFYFGVILFTLLAVLDYVVSIKQYELPFTIFPNQVAASKKIISYIFNSKEKLRVDMICSSASSFNQILAALLKTNCNVRILVFDPRKTNDQEEQSLIISTLNAQKRYFTEKRKTIQFGFYDTPASFRGISLNDILLGVGWYTYSKENASPNSIIKIMGFDNPFILADSGSKEGAIVKSFFRNEFDKLWQKKIEAEEIDSWLAQSSAHALSSSKSGM